MLSQPNCKYCSAALGLLEGLGHEVEVYDVQEESLSLMTKILRVTNTVPQLYGPDAKFIGGYTELKEHLNGST